jgi:hypothetical protein
MAICRRRLRRLGTDEGSSTWLVLDDDALAENLAELGRNHAACRIGDGAGRKRHDDAQRTRRIRIGRECRARNKKRPERQAACADEAGREATQARGPSRTP